jgi:uncharacterized protein (DUF362 family)
MAKRDEQKIKSKVAIVRYAKPLESVRRAVEISGCLDALPRNAKVFVKPNILLWTSEAVFPKWGVITTSRVVEDMVILLKERGIDKITVGEGMLVNPKDRQTPGHAFEALGYNVLRTRYGIRCLNIFERPFKRVDLGDGVALNFNGDILESDFVVNIPVLKTHAQTVVSLSIKNLKGMLDIDSRKKCHSADARKNLHFMIARLPKALPPSTTLLDGIYTNERGPSFDGRLRRSNLLIASSDLLSADIVGAKVLGHEAREVPHLVHAAEAMGRPLDLSHVAVVGESLEAVASSHEYAFRYNERETLPLTLERMGIRGISYRKYDLSICTYCSSLNWLIISAIALAWRGEPWDDVEVLTGKIMKPTPGKKKTILIGKCMYLANKDHQDIREMIAVKGCPPSPRAIAKALHQAGIQVDPAIFENVNKAPAWFMKKYEGNPDFDESFFRIT